MGLNFTTLDPSVINFDDAGVFTPITPISVNDSSAQELTLTSGMKGILFQNVGTQECWFADATVAPATNIGVILLPRQSMFIRNAASDFSVYFKCASGLSTVIGGVEYA